MDWKATFMLHLMKDHSPGRKTLIEIAGKVLTVLEEMINLAK